MLAEYYLCYVGMTALAMAGYRLRGLRLPGGGTMPPVRASRALGVAALVAALTLAMLRAGGPQGVVCFIGTVTLAGAALVLTLSFRPAVAILPAVPFLWPLRTRARAMAPAQATGGASVATR
jgi:hypothetical protein